MQVRDVLREKNREVVTIEAEATVADALRLLVPHNIGSLPVVDEHGRLVGIFTERDVLRGVHEDCQAFLQYPLREVMTTHPVACSPCDEVNDVMGMMSHHQVGQLPVVSDGEVVGVVSVGDVIKILYGRIEAENRHLLAYLYGPA